MANLKQYAYFLKGNKLAIVENDITPENDPTSRDYGPGARAIRYKSPTENVTNGIEIEYAYSPKYQVPNPITINTNKFMLNAWTVVDGYLTFLRGTRTGWDDGWATHAKVAANEHILIRGSERWNGLHKVQEVQDDSGTHGGVKTYTKVSGITVKYATDSSVTWNVKSGDDMVIDSISSSNNFPGILINEETSGTSPSGEYFWISGSDASDHNNGLFSNIFFDSRDTMNFGSATKHILVDEATTEYETESAGDTQFDFVSDTGNPIYMREAFLDEGAYLITDIDTLNDESDNIDLPDYLTKAIVYYVKAKIAEDKADFKSKEYFMKEFKQMVEKKQSANIWGPRVIVPGAGSIR